MKHLKVVTAIGKCMCTNRVLRNGELQQHLGYINVAGSNVPQTIILSVDRQAVSIFF